MGGMTWPLRHYEAIVELDRVFTVKNALFEHPFIVGYGKAVVFRTRNVPWADGEEILAMGGGRGVSTMGMHHPLRSHSFSSPR